MKLDAIQFFTNTSMMLSMVFIPLLAEDLGIAIGMYPAALIMHVYGMKRSISKFTSFCALGWAAGFIGAAILGDYDLIFAASSFLVALPFVIALTLPLFLCCTAVHDRSPDAFAGIVK